jgi:membrane associated rhomboid family serine protease
MGIADRGYMRPPSRARDSTRMGPITLWLIILNVAVWALDPILFQAGVYYIMPRGPNVIELAFPLYGLGHFSLSLAIKQFELWRVITFQFLHDKGPVHLVFNMFGLYFFGPMIESYLGSRRYLAFYLLCGMGGPAAYLILWKAKILIASPDAPLIGASAGIFGILMAAAQIAPRTEVLVFGVIPLQLRTLARVMIAIAVFTVLVYGSSARHNAGGEAAHLGGAIVGYILIRNPDWLNIFNLKFLHRRRPPPF